MGADIIGWRNCQLQRQLGANGFFWKQKLRTMKGVVERQIPEASRHGLRISLGSVGSDRREITYSEIVQELASFDAGTHECASCPISGGRPIGCHRYITYPIDRIFEQLVFNFFVSQMAVKDSICQQIYFDVVSRCPSKGTAWHTQRGSQPGPLAVLERPYSLEWGGPLSKKHIDSAQILSSLFITLDNLAMIVGYANFWMEFIKFADDCRAEGSNTLVEVRNAYPLYISMSAIAMTEGGAILVQG
jgi:hypothetical protein